MGTLHQVYAVLGGEGFVGNAIVTALLDTYKDAQIWSLGPTQRHFDQRQYLKFDITSYDSVVVALKQCSPTVIFHSVSPLDDSPEELARIVNVHGTANVIKACQQLAIPILVYTSSFSVIAQLQDQIDCTEDMPYPRKFLTVYAETKAQAEQAVIAASGRDLSTCALRPLMITGPGDRQFVPGILRLIGEGTAWIQVGDGQNFFGGVDVRDLARAHLLAAERLLSAPEGVTGETFFITNPDHRKFWDMVQHALECVGYTPRFRLKVPAGLMMAIAGMVEWFARLFNFKPTMNRNNLSWACNTFTPDSSKARTRLGWDAQIPMMQSIADAIAQSRQDKEQAKGKQKMH